MVVWRTVRNFVQQEGLQWSGAIAFYLVLSVPPLLIAGFSVGVAIVGQETAQAFLTNQVTQFLPARQGVIERVVGQTIDTSGPAIAVSFAFLLFSGSRVFASLIAAINVMWQRLPEPGFWQRQLTRFVMVATIGALFALAGAVDLGVAIAGDAIPSPLRGLLETQLLPMGLATAGLFLLFLVVPRRSATWRTALVGAVVGAVLLRIAQAAFTAYLATVGGFESAYGPIASAAVLMTWALVASGVLLLAAHLVAVLNHADTDEDPQHGAPGQAQARQDEG